MNNPTIRNWDTFWARHKKEDLSKTSWSKRRIVKILEPYATSGKRALDVGCGSGFFSRYFCQKGMHTVSVDYSENALQMTRQVTGGQATIVKADVADTRLNEIITEHFDIVFSDGLLEHFPIDRQNTIVNNLSALLTGDGVLVTFVPNRFSPWQLIRPFFMRGIDETPFVLTGLVSLQKQNNLKVIESGGVNTLPCAFSPDVFLGRFFGMLLYTIAKR